MLFRADPHNLPSRPAAADVAASNFDDSDAWPAGDAAEDADADGTALLRLFGAAALAILALAAASIVLV